jgi:hypothetical protein
VLLASVIAVAYAVCFLITVQYKDYWYAVLNSNDSLGYIAIARCLRSWDPKIVGQPMLFWGTGYATLAVSALTGGNYAAALVVLSWVCCLLAVLFSYRLFGVGVAAWFVFIDPAMMSRSMLGGSEPLFVALFLAALVALRKRFIYWAVLLASLATTVRPIGICLVLAILIGALWKKEWARFGKGAAIATVTGLIYCLPLLLLFGNPLANFKGYSNDWYRSSLPISLPLFPIVQQAMVSLGTEPLSNTFRLGVWVLGVLFIIGYQGFFRGGLLQRWKVVPEETLGMVFVMLFCLSYNSSWAWPEFPRFIVPAVPFLLALIGTDRLYRKMLWAAAPVCGALGATYIVGIQQVVQTIRAVTG